ncbi:MAG: hypothetical protein JWR26_4860 [Pedosphaera sp.]|nr:hypothetical protein [Pedosphaera sp.]
MKILSMLAALASFVESADAALFTNSASADSFVRAAAPSLNYGGAGSLSVSGLSAVNGSGVTNGAFDSFIRFNTAAMVANFNALFGTNDWVINGATLRVVEIGAPANTLFNRGVGSFEIRWIANDAWTEGTGTPTAPTTNGICFTNEAALLNSSTDASLGIFTNAGIDTTLSFPPSLPTALVNDLGAGGEAGLYLTAVDAGIGFTMDSRSFVTNSARAVLEISAVPRPGIAGIQAAGADLVLTATNGAVGGTYYVMSSTNLMLPLSQWLQASANVPVTNGNFSIIITNAASAVTNGEHFFILRAR